MLDNKNPNTESGTERVDNGSKSEGKKILSLTPTQATIIVAIIGAASASVGALITSSFSKDIEAKKSEALLGIEKLKVEGTLALERGKQEAAANLARSDFETKLIFRAIEGSTSEEERIRNLSFFLKAGFISDPHQKIASLKPSEFPSKVTTTDDRYKLKDPGICDRLLASQLRGAARSATPRDYSDVAAKFKIDVELIRAVFDAIGHASAFYDRRPALVFSAESFAHLTDGKFGEFGDRKTLVKAHTYPLSKPSENDYARLSSAMKLDCVAALRSTSWGRGDVGVFNFRALGFDSVDEFVASQFDSERAQVEAAAYFMSRLPSVVEAKSWHEVARRYVGGGDQEDLARFGSRIEAAYSNYKRTPAAKE